MLLRAGGPGEVCGAAVCAPTEICCDLSCPGMGPGTTFCTAAGAGCPAIACPPPIVGSCEDLAAYGPGDGRCEGMFACPEDDGECCESVTYCEEGRLVTSTTCHDPCVAEGCRDNAECGPLALCDFPEGTCGGVGVCVGIDLVTCSDEVCPVIGCDGSEYVNACEAFSAGVDYALPCEGGMAEGIYVIDTLDVASADPVGDPRIVPGMKLDGLVSDGGDPGGCFHQDFISPAPDRERGIDNQLGPILSSVGGSADIDFGPWIARGELLIVIEVVGTGPGSRVELHSVRTEDGRAPRLSGGALAPGQSFRSLRSLGRLDGATAGGRTRLGPAGIFFPLIPSPTLLPLAGARLYGDVGADGIARGVLGGAFGVEDSVASIVAIDPAAIPEALARSVLTAQADLSRDSSGSCRRISAGWTFTAVPAVLLR